MKFILRHYFIYKGITPSRSVYYPEIGYPNYLDLIISEEEHDLFKSNPWIFHL